MSRVSVNLSREELCALVNRLGSDLRMLTQTLPDGGTSPEELAERLLGVVKLADRMAELVELMHRK